VLCDDDLDLLPDFDPACDFGDGGIEEIAIGGVSSIRDGDLELDLAGELCLLSRLLERELFSGFGEFLAEHFGESAGLPLMLVAVLRLFTTVVGLTERCLFLPKKRLSFGVL